ncbi:hypothetical protein LCGC14_2441050 [marine sediment metagenome]|uniref:Tc1-like transposase DDE domain-containing protein n=1 Tax=marine sediment metagenome TaxID=412755 RepID=A0A0F9ECX9_9ZZZZ
MEKRDARTLSREAQQELRNQAIRLRKGNRTYPEIAEILQVHPNTVSKWCQRYKREGADGLKINSRGRKTGSGRSLGSEQEQQLKGLIRDKTPEQLKLGFALWNRRAIQQLIKQEFGLLMPIRTVGEYLKRWGFTPQKPLRRAYEQSPVAVNGWLEQEYPKIVKEAKEQGGEIHWADETGLRSDTQHGRSYSPKGKTPVVRLPGRRRSTSLISSITNQGKVRFMLYDGGMNANLMIKFLKRLIRDAGRKVFLILDNLRVHHSKVVKQWLLKHMNEIEVHYLPSYSPELNPDEYLNCDLKSGVHSGKPARTDKELKSKTLSHMRMLQKRPGRIRKYFNHPRIAYAA